MTTRYVQFCLNSTKRLSRVLRGCRESAASVYNVAANQVVPSRRRLVAVVKAHKKAVREEILAERRKATDAVEATRLKAEADQKVEAAKQARILAAQIRAKANQAGAIAWVKSKAETEATKLTRKAEEAAAEVESQAAQAQAAITPETGAEEAARKAEEAERAKALAEAFQERQAAAEAECQKAHDQMVALNKEAAEVEAKAAELAVEAAEATRSYALVAISVAAQEEGQVNVASAAGDNEEVAEATSTTTIANVGAPAGTVESAVADQGN